MTNEEKKHMIRALMEERAAAEHVGKTEKVAGIDAELARLGQKAQTAAQRGTHRGASA